jgi:endo-1,3-1,4-beta-glycanase ExoK
MRRLVRCLVVLALAATSLAASSIGNAEPPTPTNASNVYPVNWGGQVWLARESPVLQESPAPNYWLATPENLFTDSQGRLHMIAEKVGSTFYSVGLISQKRNYGYGTYTITVDTPIASLDPMAVLGMYTYNGAYTPGRDELDVELSRWGQPSPTFNNSQFVVQPWKLKGHLQAFFSPTKRVPLTFQWTWTPKSVNFSEYDGTLPGGKLLKKWTCSTFSPAAIAGTTMNFNLWFLRGEAPYNGKSQEVILRSFSYTPAA